MKAFFYGEDGAVLNGFDVKDGADASRVIFAEFAPPCVQKQGFVPKLYCVNGKLEWRYNGTENDRIQSLTVENAELIKEIQSLRKRIDELEFQSGGSVLPHPGTDTPPVDNPPDKPFKPQPGGGLTIGG